MDVRQVKARCYEDGVLPWWHHVDEALLWTETEYRRLHPAEFEIVSGLDPGWTAPLTKTMEREVAEKRRLDVLAGAWSVDVVRELLAHTFALPLRAPYLGANKAVIDLWDKSGQDFVDEYLNNVPEPVRLISSSPRPLAPWSLSGGQSIPDPSLTRSRIPRGVAAYTLSRSITKPRPHDATTATPRLRNTSP
jgi:hypothetical protein